MRIYLLSLAAGLLVGAIYGLLNVRSPAPPVIALIGLFGILAGEQSVPIARHLFSGAPISMAWFRTHCAPHIFGELPTGKPRRAEQPTDTRTG